MYKLSVVFIFMLLMPKAAFAEETKMNAKFVTAFYPGLGFEYQIDDNLTVGINYNIVKSVNVNMTIYKGGAIQGGKYMNFFLGYGDDGSDGTCCNVLGRFSYLGTVVGYQWLLKNGINFNVDGGFVFVKPAGSEMFTFPAFGASVGYAFNLRD